ncbi:hypothetical protein P7C70_g9357, partial [Phenoliferia sp. Uapishka_3]
SIPAPTPPSLSAAPTIRRPKSAGPGIPGATFGSSPRAKLPTRPGTSAGRSSIANAFGGGHKRESSNAPTTNGETTPTSPTHPSEASLPKSPLEGGAPLLPVSSFTGVGDPSSNSALTTLAPTTLLTTLHDLFVAISSQPKTTGTVAPQAFINQLKRDNEFFRSTLHQDAHEFLNYLLNMIGEAVEKEDKEKRDKGGKDMRDADHPVSWVHSLFEGILTNETRCLTCETVTSRDESFLDLSIDIEPNSSVTSCLRQFSASEMLCHRNKFFCDKCSGLQEAEKRMKIKKLPNILALHLKRFKYEESLQRHVKLTYRVVFPFELRLFNTADGMENPDCLYELWAIVVHIGVGPHHGHYITIVKSGSRWIVFDDNTVFPIEESEIQRYSGDTPGQGSGYVLFYQAVDPDVAPSPSIDPLSQPGDSTTSSLNSASPPIESPNSASWKKETTPPPILPTAMAPSTTMGGGLGLAIRAEDFVSPPLVNGSIPPPAPSPTPDAAHSFFTIPIPTTPDPS